jgi:hypothetical protein
MVNKLKNTNIKFAITGAKALNYYGHSRHTKDTDLLFNLSDSVKVLKLFKDNNYKIVKQHWSHFTATKDNEIYDLLFTQDYNYSSFITGQDYISVNNLANMYLLSTKEQNTIDCIELLKLHDVRFDEEIANQESEKVEFIKEMAEKPTGTIHQYSPEPDEFNIEEIMEFIDE